MIELLISRDQRRRPRRREPAQERSSPATLVLPPPETPAGAPGLGFLIAYEDAEAKEGWSAGVVREVGEGCEGREFTVESRVGRLRVSRGAVFYWWAPGVFPERNLRGG